MVGSHTPTYIPSHPLPRPNLSVSVSTHAIWWNALISVYWVGFLFRADSYKTRGLGERNMTLRLRALVIPPNNCPLEHTLNIPCSTLRNVPPKSVDSRPGQSPSLKGDGCFYNSRDGICGLMFEKIQGLSPKHSCAKLAQDRILLIFLYCCSGRPLGKLSSEEWCPGSLLRSKGQPYTVTSRPGSS